MYRMLLVLLRILFPLDPVARMIEGTRFYFRNIIACLERPEDVAELKAHPLARAELEAWIAAGEHGINLLIHDRARQILGLPYVYTPRIRPPEHTRIRPLGEITARLSRALALFSRIEQLAQRRAERMRRERDENPLRLAPSAQSTSPAFAVEATHRCLLIVQIASLSPKDWGRWIARVRAQDGGGSHARGPPPLRSTALAKLPNLAATCEIAPICPLTKGFRRGA